MQWDIRGIRTKSRDIVWAMGGKNMEEQSQTQGLEICTQLVVSEKV